MFENVKSIIRQVVNAMVPYKDIEMVEKIETPLSNEMSAALDLWYSMYLDQAPWLSSSVKSLNLPAFVSGELARQMLLEMDWHLTGKHDDASDPDHKGVAVDNPRALYLRKEFAKCITELRKKLEQGVAAGGMTILPYPNVADGHIYFSYTMDWGLYPISFGDDGNLTDVIFRDTFVDGRTYYTRLERHTIEGKNVKITQRAFKSANENYIGNEINLSDVERWATLKPEATVENSEGQMFGWFKVASANSVDVNSPMGVSVFSKAVNLIKEADMQYSRFLWEYEGSELAVDVDPLALRNNAVGNAESPHLNERLFRKMDLGQDGTYHVFAPQIRDASLINGLNELYKKIEDQCGLARGTISEAGAIEAKSATEIKILKQRTYATVHDNQVALEACLKDVIRAMDKFATLYNLAPEGEYDVSFDWDDNILTDQEQRMNEYLALRAQGLISKKEIRMWYFGETEEQAEAALQAVLDETAQTQQAMMLALPDDAGDSAISGLATQSRSNGGPQGISTKIPTQGGGRSSATSNNNTVVGTGGSGTANRTQNQTLRGRTPAPKV